MILPGVLRCGWPFRLDGTSTVVHCRLPFGHHEPRCRLLDDTGRTLASAPRFASTGSRA